MSLNTIDQIKRRNRDAGMHYFDPDTMRFFRSRVSQFIEPLPNGGALFITSEQNHGLLSRTYPRLFSIRLAQADGDIDTVGDFQAYRSRGAAIRMMRRIAAWCRS